MAPAKKEPRVEVISSPSARSRSATSGGPPAGHIMWDMHPEFSRLIGEAARIQESGRWTAVNEAIERLAANPGADNDWWVKVFGSLCAEMFSEYLALKRAYEEERDKTALLAWRARNLLGLSVWCLYCSKSRAKCSSFLRRCRAGRFGDSCRIYKMGNRYEARPRVVGPDYWPHPELDAASYFGRNSVSRWALQASSKSR